MATNSFCMINKSLLAFSFILLMISGAESTACVQTCDSAIQVKKKDTCNQVAATYGMTPNKFLSFNPNLPCRHLFIGQWICVAGTAC
ncbi:unnamed protein product [Linum tenue]|uniref:LysM domain-containing protein n=1 Tax=Linum tenue TaxID=586396 RepID=A0AAV0NRT4_9ROSI|nr:unnamed protein product [Linum tenue]